MSKTALILFAHGARDPEWADPMRRVCAAVREQAPELRVELAFPRVHDSPICAPVPNPCSPRAFERIVVLPMFIARGGHLKRDVPLLLEELRQRHPQTHFELTGAIGEAEPIVQAMARHALALAGS